MTSQPIDLNLPKVGYRGGANAYVRKPVKFADFADAVQAVGVFWLLLNESAPSGTPESD